MTREEAIEILKSECYVFNPLNFDRTTLINTALDMAVKALEKESSKDHISREKLIKDLNFLYNEDGYIKDTRAKRTMEVIMEQSPVNSQESKTGHWIHAKVGKWFPSNDYKCSECGNTLDFDGVNCGRGDVNYCPNCGAKMVDTQEREKINCKSTKCKDCKNHNYCDYEAESEG